MTVSLKRLIATVVLTAMALAGTPTNALANDGLNLTRYGFKSEKNELEVHRPVSANLNENPFRKKTVTATLRGASIRIERATVTESNVAKLLTKGTTHSAVASAPAMVDHSICQIHLPVFQNASQGSFYDAWLGSSRNVMEFGSNLLEESLGILQHGAEAELQFATSLTATSNQHTAPIFAKLPAYQLPAAEPVASDTGISGRVAKQSQATIGEIQTSQMQAKTLTTRPTQALLRRSNPNILVVLLAAVDQQTFEPGQNLLIQEYMPPAFTAANAKSKGISVPAMSINFQRKTKPEPVDVEAPANLLPVIKQAVEIWMELTKPLLDVEQAASMAQGVIRKFDLRDEYHGSIQRLEEWSVDTDFR